MTSYSSSSTRNSCYYLTSSDWSTEHSWNSGANRVSVYQDKETKNQDKETREYFCFSQQMAHRPAFQGTGFRCVSDNLSHRPAFAQKQ